MSIGSPMGPDAVASWPEAARRKPPADSTKALRVPAVRDGRRNLALLPAAKAAASSVFEGGKQPIHQIAHLRGRVVRQQRELDCGRAAGLGGDRPRGGLPHREVRLGQRQPAPVL